MSVKVVHPENALSPGAELWLIAGPRFSHWSRQIDWYLNFQIARAGFHEQREISRELSAVSERVEFVAPRISIPATAALLVESIRLLPSRAVAVVGDDSPDAWLKSALQVWRDFGYPSVRAFLPPGVTVRALEKGVKVELATRTANGADGDTGASIGDVSAVTDQDG